MGKAERDKGARAERELAQIFRDHGIEARRGYTFCRESDVVGVPGIHIETKHVERLNVREAYRQAVAEAEKRKDGRPVVCHKKNRDIWLATMDLETFIFLLKGGKDD